MKRLTIGLGAAALAAGVLAAYVVWWSGTDERMSDLAAALVPVSSAVDGYVNFSDPPADLNGQELLIQATEHNPKLLERFSGYVVVVRRDGDASSVLVCDENREHALIEDSGCTGEYTDARLWEQTPAPACEFQLDLQQVCKTGNSN